MTRRGSYTENLRKSFGLKAEKQVDWRSWCLDKPDERQAAINLLTYFRNQPPQVMNDYLMGLNRPDRAIAETILTRIAPNLASEKSLEFFASYVVTKDEHKQGDESVRPFPSRIEKPYIWDILDSFLTEKLILIEKSRQLMVSWLCVLYALWLAKYHKNRMIFIQSRKEENAANLVYNTEPNQARLSFIECNLPQDMRSEVIWSYGKAIFKETGSMVWGIPEGGDQIRSYVPSAVFSDEAAFQPEFEGAWKAAKPCVDGGGQFIAVSTARNGSYMKQLLRCTTGEAA